MRRNPRTRFTGLSLGAMLLVLVLLLAACGSDDDDDGGGATDTTGGDAKGSLVMGSKDFTGALILGQLYGQALEAAGYDVSYQENLGGTEIAYRALESGEIDLYPEFQGTLITYLTESDFQGDTDATFAELQSNLEGTDIVASQPAPAVDVNGYYMLADKAEELGVTTLSDLEGKAQDLVLGGPQECPERRPCLLGLQEVYGLQFKEFRALDAGGPITAQALEDGTIDVATLFTGSSIIPEGAVLLEDDQQLQPADNPVVLVRADKDSPEIQEVLDGVSEKLTTEAYNELNARVSEEQAEPADVARQWLEEEGLI